VTPPQRVEPRHERSVVLEAREKKGREEESVWIIEKACKHTAFWTALYLETRQEFVKCNND
jgi:hypothetical protein